VSRARSTPERRADDGAADARRAYGFRCHSGWAVVVVVSGTTSSPSIVERRRIVLCDDALPRQPFHAVAEVGAPRAVIEAVRQAAEAGAADAITDLARTWRAAAVAVVAPARRIPDDLDRVLASHALLHAAEGALYEQAVLDAAEAAGLPFLTIDPKTVPSAAVDAVGKRIGPPWQKDHKLATMAALDALATLGAR
jgi:hypothetical protein